MARPSLKRQDVACLALMAVSASLLWIPVLDAVSLNPDESQYEATASYLAATGTSVFLPHGAPAIFGLFKLMTLLVGPYPILAMRVLVAVVALGSATILFRMVRRVADRWSGLIAGLVFLHYAPRLEGFVVNREWFASFFTLAGLGLYTALGETRRRSLWLILAGGLCGMALWFKLQASFIVFVIPVWMVLDAIARRSIATLRRDLGWFTAGGVGSGIAYLAPFWFQGTLAQFLGFMFTDIDVYAAGNAAAVRAAGDGGQTLLDHFLLGLPYRPLLLIAYLAASIVVAGWTGRLAGRSSPALTWLTRRDVTLFAAYLFLAMICVQLGGRFFAHYYQLMLPAVAALVGLGFHFFSRIVRDRGWRIVAIVSVAVLAIERFVALLPDPVWSGAMPWPRGPLTILFALGALGILAWLLQRPLRRGGPAVACWIALQSGTVVLSEQLVARPETMAHSRHDFAALTEYMSRVSQPGDRLFVWGWAPEIYSLTRLEAASHLTFCQYVANDLKGVPDRPALNEEWAALLMSELAESRPRFIVDASRVSWFETERWIYDLRNYPDFELNRMLQRDYRLTTHVDDCAIWERLEDRR